jgi:nitrogen fixation protein FixH
MIREIKGWHVAATFVLAFGTIIAVNLTLAVNAVKTFPGLEVKNSYVASQSFDADRKAQRALDWTVAARLEGGELVLDVQRDGIPVDAVIEEAVFGRATHRAQDQSPDFVFDGKTYRAPVEAGAGNWNLRIKMRAGDGTLFQQRIVLRTAA